MCRCVQVSNGDQQVVVKLTTSTLEINDMPFFTRQISSNVSYTNDMSTVEFTSTTRIASLVLKPSIDVSFTEEQLRSLTTKLVYISYQYVVLENKFLSKTWKVD